MHPSIQTEHLFRFTKPSLVLAALPALCPFYLQVRNRGGGLGKRIESLDLLQVDDPDFAFDPDNGLGFAAKDLIHIHAGVVTIGSRMTYALDFEFAGFSGGLSLQKFPDMIGIEEFVSLVRDLPCEELAHKELIAWRAVQAKPIEMCPSCERHAEVRVRHPERHALYRIFRHVSTRQSPIEFRLSSDHVDMISSFTPFRITLRNGLIILSDVLSHAAIHVDMRTVHSLIIDVITLDSVSYSSLQIYDTTGTQNFNLMAEGVEHAAIWRDLCESASEQSEH